MLPKLADVVLFTPAANTLVSLHICAGKVTGQCDKYQDLLCLQRRLLGVCTFAQARLNLRHSIEISCAGCNGDFCNVYVNSECCGESAPATATLLCNHQCVVSMLLKCSQCVVIKFLNKTFASLPRKKYKVVLIHPIAPSVTCTACLPNAPIAQVGQTHMCHH